MVRRPNPFAMAMGMLRKNGMGKKTSTPIKLNRKCAKAIVMALEELAFNVAAIIAVTVVPMLAPSINGTAFRRVIIFCATMGTTTDVVMVLERMAAVVNNPQKNDLMVFLKKNRLNFSGELAISNPDISFLNSRIDRNNKPKENRAKRNPLGMIFTRKSIIELNPDHKGVKVVPDVPLLTVKKFSVIQPERLERNPLKYSNGNKMDTVRMLKKS